jgi:hypothetical protein
MGEINLDNTGSGSSVTLSSDGTSLLLDGTAIGGGGGADLYAANESSPTSQPSATGTNAIAIGEASVSAGTRGIAINIGDTSYGALSGTTNPIAIGYQARVRANVQNSLAIGTSTDVNNAYSTAVGYNAHAFGSNAQAFGSSAYAANDGALALGHNAQAGTRRAVSLGNSRANGEDSFAAVITNNTTTYGATGASSVAIGYQAKATGAKSVAISSNTYSGSATASGGGAVAIGDGPTASGIGSTSIGRGCTASGTNAIAMGRSAQATAEAAVAIGYPAYSDVKGGIAFAGSGYFGSALGDAQGRMYILRVQTTDATATELAESSARIKVPTNGAVVFDGLITGLESGVNSYAGWKIEGMIVNDAGTTTLVNSAITTIHNTPNWGLALTADNTNNRLAITVTGEASHNIRWVANIRTVETIYA